MSYADLAPSRNDVHVGHDSQRILGENQDKVGIVGEFAFGEFCGLWPDTTLKPGGDNGIDFFVPLIFTVDVKTARKPFNLIHEQGKPFADIYVLAKYDDSDDGKAELLGWAWGATLQSAPVKDFGHGVINHYIPAGELKSMDALKRRLLITSGHT